MKLTTLANFFPIEQRVVTYPRHLSSVHRPPVKCQGIKAKLVKIILSNASWHGRGTWIEPFLGSGIVLLNARPGKAFASDINPHIINLYNNIKTGEVTPVKVHRFLSSCAGKLRTGGKQYYNEVRDRFNHNGTSYDFIFLTRSCFNGLMRFNSGGGFNSPFCHHVDRFDAPYITKIVNQISWTRSTLQATDYSFSCRDWRDAVSTATDDDFVYLDPPYSGRDTGYYGTWTEKDDEDIIAFMQSTPARVMLSTWAFDDARNNPFYRKVMESGRFTSKECRHYYHVGAAVTMRHGVTEAIVMNYDPDGI